MVVIITTKVLSLILNGNSGNKNNHNYMAKPKSSSKH